MTVLNSKELGTDFAALVDVCDSCGSDEALRYSPAHAAKFCARCFRRENVGEQEPPSADDADMIGPKPWPTTCADVTYDMAGEGHGEPSYEAEIGDLVWNPKGGYGHVIVSEVPCAYSKVPWEHGPECGCGGWGSGLCPSITQVCECGEDNSCRDHHYELLARKPK